MLAYPLQTTIFDDIKRILERSKIPDSDIEEMWLETCVSTSEKYGLTPDSSYFYEIAGASLKRRLIDKICEGRGASCKFELEYGPVLQERY
jgi:hypothetical protein